MLLRLLLFSIFKVDLTRTLMVLLFLAIAVLLDAMALCPYFHDKSHKVFDSMCKMLAIKAPSFSDGEEVRGGGGVNKNINLVDRGSRPQSATYFTSFSANSAEHPSEVCKMVFRKNGKMNKPEYPRPTSPA